MTPGVMMRIFTSALVCRRLSRLRGRVAELAAALHSQWPANAPVAPSVGLLCFLSERKCYIPTPEENRDKLLLCVKNLQ